MSTICKPARRGAFMLLKTQASGGRLHAAGIYTYRQVVEWRAGQVRAISEDLKLSDRIRRDGWQKQARALHREKYGQAP